jgi:dTDP-glucose 4,6-dehydratase
LQIRDWLHVEDHARAILLVLEHGEPGGVYNVAGGSPLTNLDLTRVLMRLCERSMDTHAEHVADRAGHDRRYAVSSQRLHALGWKPQVPFADGIAQTVAWYRANESWWRPLKEHASVAPAERRSREASN